MLWIYKKDQVIEFKVDWSELWTKPELKRKSSTKYCDQSKEIKRQNFASKVKKSNQIGQELQIWNYFCIIFVCYYKSVINGKKTVYEAFSWPSFDFALVLTYFYISQVLVRSGTHEATRIRCLSCKLSRTSLPVIKGNFAKM